MAKQRIEGKYPVSNDRAVDIFIKDLADAEARLEELNTQQGMSEEELLEAVELYKFLYPDGEPS
jgi:hypothetical protein